MIYIYRPAVSEGGKALEDALNDMGTPARFTQGRLLRERFRPDRDKLVCWGARWEQTAIPDNLAINNIPLRNKFQEANHLRAANVATVEVSRAKPATVAATRPAFTLPASSYTEAQLRQLIERASAHLAQPLPPASVWLARRNSHVGGDDLRQALQVGDFYSRQEAITNEYRIHIWRGKSIRAGEKTPREGFEGRAHPWIRSYESGWRVNYTGFQSTRPMREMAAAAVEALGLTFGAVDLALKSDGSLMVLEVNRAPGVEGGTTDTYAEWISKWNRGADVE